MKINALLDVNVVAHETEDEVAVLLELEAPAALADATRPQASLQVVLDRSGSMGGAPLEGAKKALVALVRRLEPTDNFGLVTFDDSAQVVVPAGPLADKDAVIAQLKIDGNFRDGYEYETTALGEELQQIIANTPAEAFTPSGDGYGGRTVPAGYNAELNTQTQGLITGGSADAMLQAMDAWFAANR